MSDRITCNECGGQSINTDGTVLYCASCYRSLKQEKEQLEKALQRAIKCADCADCGERENAGCPVCHVYWKVKGE